MVRQIYEKFNSGQRWRQNLLERATHKALDIPVEDVNIKTGMGWKELAVIAAMVLGAGAIASQVFQQPPAAVAPVDSEYDVRFFDADGQPIDVQPWKSK